MLVIISALGFLSSTPTQSTKLKYKAFRCRGKWWRIISDSPSSLFRDMLKPFIVIAIVLVLVLLVSEAFLGQFSSLHFIGSRGNVQFLGVEAYWDRGLTNETRTVYWGSLLVGSSKNVTLYLRSMSNVETTLELRTANWTLRNSTFGIVDGPRENSPYMNLTWNYHGTTILPNEIIQLTLTLSTGSSADYINLVSTEDVKGFDFDIIISVDV